MNIEIESYNSDDPIKLDLSNHLLSKLKLAAMGNSNSQNPDVLKPKFASCIAELKQAMSPSGTRLMSPDVRIN
jgi:hypothetical protein